MSKRCAAPPAAALIPPSDEAGRFNAAAALLIVRLLALLLVLAACGEERRPPDQRVRPAMPTPDPRPTAVLTATDAAALPAALPWLSLRAPAAAPAAPITDYARTRSALFFDGTAVYSDTVGGRAWADLYLFWQHPDPAQVDYYEVYTTTNVPYFSVPMSATLALTTTAQGAVFPESPAPFNPVPAAAGYTLGSAFDFYVIRAVNAAGASEPSATVGTVAFSLISAPYDWETNPAQMPTLVPTAGPSPTPVPTATRTPVPPGTPGPSPTPP